MHNHTSSIIVAVIGIVFGLTALLFKFAGEQALRAPIRHDGIGGKDTENLATGCMGHLLYLSVGFSSIVLFIVAAILFGVGY
jgi:hypothetical protein